MKIAIQIAITHLWAKKKQSIVAMLGVTFGISMFIVMISFMTGVNKVLEDTTLNASPHLRIYNEVTQLRPAVMSQLVDTSLHHLIIKHPKPAPEKKGITNAAPILKELEKNSQIWGISPIVNVQVFYAYGAVELGGVLAGADLNAEHKLYQLADKLIEGTIETVETRSDAILMGTGLAQKLNIHVGDKVQVATANGRVKLLTVTGLFKFGMGAIDNARSYVSLQTARELLGESGSFCTEIHIKLADLNQAKTLAPQLSNQFGYPVEDWETANQTILTSFIIRNVLTFVVVATLLVVAGFGIYNIMNMTIYDKMKDIAILKATGFAGKDIVHIFMFQAVFIGTAGGLSGLIIGFSLSWLLSVTPFDAGEFLNIDTFPVNFNPIFYVSGFVFGVLTTSLAGYLPARKASKVDPVSILRG